MKCDVWLAVFWLGLVSLTACSSSPAAQLLSTSSAPEPIFHTESLDAKPACATHAPTLVTDSDFRPLTQSAPRALVVVTQDARMTIEAISADGEAFPLTGPRSIGHVQLSADGSTLAYEVIQGPNPANNFVEIRALASGRTWRLTPGDGCAIFRFTLDASGQRLAYLQVAMRGRFRPSAWQVSIADMPPPGAERSHTLRGESETALMPFAWSVATGALVFRASVPFQTTGHRGVWQAQLDGSNLRPLLRESDFVGESRLSPDGRWLVYRASDADRLPTAYIAGVGEPPANRIAAINLLTGETRVLAETTQSFGDLAWSNTRALFTEGVWTDNQFRYDKISSVQADASVPQTLVTVASSDSIGSVQGCEDDSVVYSIHSANGNALHWWKGGSTKTLASQPNTQFQILGCVK